MTTYWITVTWTTAEVGKTVALALHQPPDLPIVGVQLTVVGNSEQQWVSTSGQLTILPEGSGGHLKATLSPDHGPGAGNDFVPGHGLVYMAATWKC